ncbi:hypothetical protein Gpo141_00002128 [Globisporangium polare]
MRRALRASVVLSACGCCWHVAALDGVGAAVSVYQSGASERVHAESSTTRRALTDGIDSQHVLPRVATYKNAYGAHFTCTTTCYFVLTTYLITLTCLLVILLLIPVTSPSSKADSKQQSPPFLLWFGSDEKKYEAIAEPERKHSSSRTKRRGFWPRLLAVLRGDDRDLPVTDHDDHAATAQLLSKKVAISEKPTRVESVKTYESIGVDTEDLPQPPSSPTGRRGSIFANAPPPPKRPTRHRIPRTTTTDLHAGGAMGFGASETSFFSDMTLVSNAETTRGLSEILNDGAPVDKNEKLVRTIERRASIQNKVEKRKEQAKSDISYENLRDEEIQMYEYLEFVRELLEGMVIKKLCQKSAKVVKRTFYITKDMTTVYWNKIGSKNWINKKSSLDPSRIDKVLKGFHGNANVESKGKSEKSSLYVSVVCSDGKHLDLEAKDEAMRQRIFVGFSRLASEKRQQQHQKQQQEEQQQQQSQVANAMMSPMAAAAPAHVAPPYSDDDEEEKPPSYVAASTAVRVLGTERQKDPEDTRERVVEATGVAFAEPGVVQQQQQRGSMRRASTTTGRLGSLTSPVQRRGSTLSPIPSKSDPETENVSADVLRELRRGDLEEKDDGDD